MKKWGNRTERVRERAAREEAIIEKAIIGLRDREFDKQVWIIEHQDIQYLINVTQRKWKPEPNEIFIVKLMTSVHGVLLPRAWRLHVTVCAETLDMALKAQKAYCAIYYSPSQKVHPAVAVKGEMCCTIWVCVHCKKMMCWLYFKYMRSIFALWFLSKLQCCKLIELLLHNFLSKECQVKIFL